MPFFLGMKPYSTEWERWPIDHLLPSHLKGIEKAGGDVSGNVGSSAPDSNSSDKRATTGVSNQSNQSRRRYGKRSKSPIKSNGKSRKWGYLKWPSLL